jgi:hypothetical protein
MILMIFSRVGIFSGLKPQKAIYLQDTRIENPNPTPSNPSLMPLRSFPNSSNMITIHILQNPDTEDRQDQPVNNLP